MKPTHEVYIKVPVSVGSDYQAARNGIIIANKIGGKLENVYNLDKLPF